MPSKSPVQHRLMAAVAASPEFAKKVDIPQNVGQEYVAADAAKGSRMKRKMPSFMNDKKQEKPQAKSAKMANLFAGRETAKEEAAERKKFPSKKAYAKAEAKFEGEKMPKFACGGKVKRYEDGGVIEGPNKNIDDDTRARAMKFARGEMGSEAPAAKPAAKAAPRASRLVPAKTAPKVAEYKPEPPKTFDPNVVGSGPATGRFKPRAETPVDSGKADRAARIDEAMKGIREAGQYRETGEAGKPAFLPGMGGAGRAAANAIRGMGAPATKATAEIGKRVAQGVDEAMYARTAETAKKATSAARSAAAKPAERAMTAPKKPKASPRARTRGNQDEAGVEFKSGGSVRGGGAAKRGVGRGKMC